MGEYQLLETEAIKYIDGPYFDTDSGWGWVILYRIDDGQDDDKYVREHFNDRPEAAKRLKELEKLREMA